MLRTVAIGAAALSTALLLGGCDAEPSTARESSDVNQVRTDREPIAERFPAFGDFTAVEWVGGSLTTGDAPGPTDVYIDGFVTLADDDARDLRSAYAWQRDRRFGPDPRQPLRVPERVDGPWSRSDDFSTQAMADGYAGELWVDLDASVVFVSVSST